MSPSVRPTRMSTGIGETESLLGGSEHDDPRSDLTWMLAQPRGSVTVRALGYALRKALRRCTTRITFDRVSFERAVAQAPPDALYVLLPSHRSFFDFLLMSYLCFAHPELGIPVPHIAAAEEFSRVPIVGRVLKKAQAFYIRRGVGKEQPAIGSELRRIVDQRGSLMFFVEGERSRARRFLVPRRGLLRGLQATGQPFTVLPIALSYDRVPEEGAFEGELRGGAKPRMTLRALLRWLGQLARGQIRLGRVHISCGEPAQLDARTDVAQLARTLIAEQQRSTVVTRFHLRTFLSQARLPGVGESLLAQAITRRGGRVLASDLPIPERTSPALMQSLCNQWLHWFLPDARALFPNNLAVQDHAARHLWTRAVPAGDVGDRDDPRLRRIVAALVQPIVLDYELAVRRLGTPAGSPDRELPFPSPRALAAAYPVAHLPFLEDAYRALCDRGILKEAQPGTYTWGSAASEVGAFHAAVTADFAQKKPRPRIGMRPRASASVHAKNHQG